MRTSQARERLLAAAVDHALDAGIADLSLRQLARGAIPMARHVRMPGAGVFVHIYSDACLLSRIGEMHDDRRHLVQRDRWLDLMIGHPPRQRLNGLNAGPCRRMGSIVPGRAAGVA
jgi:AcrR family transcriptional regulator